MISHRIRHAMPRHYLVGILLVALFLRLAVMVGLQTWQFNSEREFGFEAGEIGYALATGQGFSWPRMWRPVGPRDQMIMREHAEPTSWEAPIYPFLIGIVFWMLGPYTGQAAIALELFQALMSLLAVGLLYRLGKRIFDERVGLLAAFLFAVYPAALHFAVQKVGYTALFVLLSLLLLDQFLSLTSRPRLLLSGTTGFLIGITSLVNPVIFAFWPFAILWFLWVGRDPWPRRFFHAATIILCLTATIAPWLVRNYFVFNHFVFIKPNFTKELVAGNYRFDEVLSQADNQIIEQADDAELGTFFFRKALVLISADPKQFLFKSTNRIRYYWFKIKATNQIKLFSGVVYYAILGSAFLGVCLYRLHRSAQLLIVFLLTMPLPFYVTWAAMLRYRFPVEPILILFASCTVWACIDWQSCRKSILMSSGILLSDSQS